MPGRLKLALACIAAVLGACDTVTSPVPLGQQSAAIEAGDWQGRWYNAEGDLDLEVIDGPAGLVRIAYDDDGEFREMDLQLRTAGEWTFASVTEKDFEESEGLATSPCSPVEAPATDVPECEEQPRAYLWARIEMNPDAIIAWSPDAEVFVRLVESGLLPGTVSEGSVVLGSLTAEHYQIITSSAHGVVLDWEHPMVFFRAKPE